MNNVSEVDSERENRIESKKRVARKETQIKRLDIESLSLQREGMGYTIICCIHIEKT